MLIRYFRKFNLQSIMPFYAVARGRVTGTFTDWSSCEYSVKGFKGARYKKFNTSREAKDFLKLHGIENTDEDHSTNNSSTDSDSSPSASCSHSGKSSKIVEFWDEKEKYESDDEDFLLAAAEEVEGVSLLSPEKRKRSAKTLAEPSKKLKITTIESVGLKKFGKFNFPIDADGFVICYTDGSCENNGQANPVAGLGVYFSDDHPLNTARPVTGRATNNVGEIQASIYAIKIARDLGIKKLCICTDSQFLISSITTWIQSWKRKGWRTVNGQPVKNKEDFIELDGLLLKNDIEINWHHVKGHQGIAGNEKADRLARKGAQMYRELHEKNK